MSRHYFTKKRQNDNKIKEIREHSKQDMKELERGNMELRAENRRFLRQLHQERQDIEMEERIFRAREVEAMRKNQLVQEEKLAQQLQFMKHQEMKEFKLRQHIRENSVELRDVEAKLRTAYATRALMTQCAEKRTAELEQRMHDKYVYETLKSFWERDKEVELKAKEEEMNKKCEYSKEIKDQLIAREKLRKKAYYEFLEEKRVIDLITAQILEEDARMAEEEYHKKQRTKAEMDEFKKQQDELKKKREAGVEEENRCLLEYMKRKAAEEEEQLQKKKEKIGKKEELSFMLGSRLFEQELLKLEHAEMLEELQAAQSRESDEARVRTDLEAKVQQRLALRESNMEQARLKYERLQREAAEDRMWQQRMMEQFAENDRLEQMSAQRRRLKQQEHKREVEKMLVDRQAARAAEMQNLVLEQEKEDCEAEQRRKIIEEERLRMLREHATGLVGYLPRGLLRQDDLPHLGCDLIEKMKALKVPAGTTPINIDKLPRTT